MSEEESPIGVAKVRMQKSIQFLRDELKQIRSGRATPAMVEGVVVSVYGSKMRLNQLANISAPEPRSLVVQPWDKSLLKEIKTALSSALPDTSAQIDGEIIRISVPPLNEETRQKYASLVREKLEQCRIALRNIRQDSVQEYERLAKNKDLSEEDFKKRRDEMDELIKKMNEEVERIGNAKISEIMTI